jgi:hypothetical protein
MAGSTGLEPATLRFTRAMIRRALALDSRDPRNYVRGRRWTMTKRAHRKLAVRLKRARRDSMQAQRRHKRAVAAYKRLLRMYRAA